jgi:hypothetical protein
LDEAEQTRTIVAIVREGDPDRYLATLFASSSARDDLFALYALNVELARIGERVSEPDLGKITLQWWRDALARAATGEATASPVADAIGSLLQHHPGAAEPIRRMIDAREFDIAVKIMPDMAALDAYLDATAGSLFAAAVTIGGGDADRLQSLYAEAGHAYGLTGLMRSLPVHAALERCDLRTICFAVRAPRRQPSLQARRVPASHPCSLSCVARPKSPWSRPSGSLQNSRRENESSFCRLRWCGLIWLRWPRSRRILFAS